MAHHFQLMRKRPPFPLRLTLTGLALAAGGCLTLPMGSLPMIVGCVTLLAVLFGEDAQDLIDAAGGQPEE